MLKPLVPNFYSDISVRLRNIAEKQVPVKLKPIVDNILFHQCRIQRCKHIMILELTHIL